MNKLPLSFYQRDNVVKIAKELLGKILVTRWNKELTSGRIVEVEAYEGVIDRASHAFGGKKTLRNEIMYRDGGFAYVYLCYGIHHLFNVVTHFSDTPHAVLVRPLNSTSVGSRCQATPRWLRGSALSMALGHSPVSRATMVWPLPVLSG